MRDHLDSFIFYFEIHIVLQETVFSKRKNNYQHENKNDMAAIIHLVVYYNRHKIFRVDFYLDFH